jgi:hypothetical protein
VRADPDLLSQVLLGLLANAADVTAPGGEVFQARREGARSSSPSPSHGTGRARGASRARISSCSTTKEQRHRSRPRDRPADHRAHGGRIDVAGARRRGARFHDPLAVRRVAEEIAA